MRWAAHVGAVIALLSSLGCSGGGSSSEALQCSFVTTGTFAPGDTIPGFALRLPTGGRADLRAQGRWDAGVWTVMFTRPRITADPTDDVQLGADFEPPAAGTNTLRYFSVAVLDNMGGAFDGTMTSQNYSVYSLGNETTTANLKAKWATAAPTANAGDTNWGASFTKPAGVGVAGTSTGASVTLRASYDVTNFYLLAVWNDATKDDRKQSWVFDGTTWTRRSDKGNDGSWPSIDSDGSQWDEDRLALWWNISVTDFGGATGGSGCLALCHSHRMGTHTLGEKADLWHWKAARTNPVGFADDQRLNDGTWGGHAMAGRTDDAGTGIDVANTDAASPPLPKYMSETDPGANASHIFLNSPIAARQAVTYAAGGFVPGAVIPGYYLRSPSGSRADLRAVGTWEDGQWRVLFTRALTTVTTTDDRQFDALSTGAVYTFSVAVLDNMGGAFDATMTSQNTSPFTMGDETLQPGASLKARLVTAAPSRNISDPGWGPAFSKPAGAGVSGTAAGGPVSLRAAYDATNLYVLAVWNDATRDDRKESWVWTGAAWTKRLPRGTDNSWATLDADGTQWDEDRLAIWWDISATNFSGMGCLALCHSHRMGSHIPGEKADLWHWKAARTNPMGFADDQRMTDGTWGGHAMSGRSDDTGTGMEVNNAGPTYMAEGDPNANARYLHLAPTLSRRAVAFSNSGFSAGATIPGFTLRSPTGSRADLRISGTYAAGQWSVLFTRSRTTSWASDDVQLGSDFSSAPGTLRSFSVAVLDNMGGAFDATMTSQNASPYTLGEETLQPAADLRARLAGAAPTLNPADVNWGPVFTKPTGVGIAGTATGASVDLRAAYDSSNFYLLAIWTDATESNLKESWSFDGTSWTRRTAKGNDGSWATIDADGSQFDEDRLAIWWDIGVAVGGSGPFTAQGCQTLCHDHRMGSHMLGEKADLWHWKAARTHPVGCADDQRLNDGSFGGHSMAGRSDDTGTGTESGNLKAGLPAYMAEGGPGVGATYLLSWTPTPWTAVPFVNLLPTQVCVPVAGQGTGSGGAVSYSLQIDPLFGANCFCHRSGGVQNGLNLDTYANLMAGGNSQATNPEVVPGNGAGSLLYQKVSLDAPPVGARMPFGGPYLTAEQQKLIKDWIDQGALNN